jgi:flavorubredoxin
MANDLSAHDEDGAPPISMGAPKAPPVFPREFAPGAFWFSGCLRITVNGKELHNHNSCFLLMGDQGSVLIDTAPPFAWDYFWPQLLEALGGRQLDYIFPTHPEAPHMGNLGRLLRAFPAAKVIGDTRNYELYAPEAAHRLQPMGPGEKIDLGGSTFVVVPAVVHDLVNTLWAYEEERKILFVRDGYPYTHDHREGECAMTSNELAQLPRVEDTRVVIEGALGWTRYVDAQITINNLRALLAEYPADIIAPTHGGVIMNARELTDVFETGLRQANEARP